MLTYRISSYPTKGLTKEEVDEEIAKAFQMWSDATNLNFHQRSSGPIHIEIRFVRRDHGDELPFDGNGGTVSHAFYPRPEARLKYGGHVHFDDSETWTIEKNRRTNLLENAAHALGHSLGLSHSDVPGALMAPFYQGDWNPRGTLILHKDDVRAVQTLYGKSNWALKRSGKLDTIVTMGNSETYAFFADDYWKVTESFRVEPGYPRNTSDDWNGLPANLDASFTWTDGKTYFFKGSMYWRFSDVGKMDTGYPKQLDQGFDGIPDNVDAAFVWPIDYQIYFLKGSNYWKFDPNKSPPLDSSYPRPLSDWDGIPESPDAATTWANEATYIFKDGLYYRFDNKHLKLNASVNPPYPQEMYHCWTWWREFGNIDYDFCD